MAISTVAKSGVTTFDKFQRTSAGSFAQQFVTTGAANTCLTSPDGITWTSRTVTGSFGSITAPHRNGSLLCVFDEANNRFTSADGVTWVQNGQLAGNYATGTLRASHAAYNPNDGTVNIFARNIVTSANGYMFDVTNATCIGDTQILGSLASSTGYATNGSVYIFSGLAGSNYLWKTTTRKGGQPAAQAYGSSAASLGAVFGAGLFAVTDSNGTGVYTSPDAVTWTSRGTGARYIYFVNDLFLANDGHLLWTSTNGTTWTSRTVTGIGTNAISQIVFGNGLFVLVANTGFIATSPDGITWTSRTSGTTNRLNGVCFA
jgi:hypothetical protein